MPSTTRTIDLEITAYVFSASDSHGNTFAEIVPGMCTTVQVYGLSLPDGVPFSFESEVRHFAEALECCNAIGIKYNIDKIVVKHSAVH